jgi:hypothetical protein
MSVGNRWSMIDDWTAPLDRIEPDPGFHQT